MDVSDRRMQVLLTPEAKIASDFSYIRAIFAVVGFVSALKARPSMGRALLANKRLRAVRRRRFCVPFCKGRDAKNARKPRGKLPRVFFQSAFAGTALSALCKHPSAERALPA